MSMCAHPIWTDHGWYRECGSCGHTEPPASRVRHQVEDAMADLCWHCGKGPDADGDHTCPCPYTDADCPDHAPPAERIGDSPTPKESETDETGGECGPEAAELVGECSRRCVAHHGVLQGVCGAGRATTGTEAERPEVARSCARMPTPRTAASNSTGQLAPSGSLAPTPPSTPPARSLMTDPGRRERNESEECPECGGREWATSSDGQGDVASVAAACVSCGFVIASTVVIDQDASASSGETGTGWHIQESDQWVHHPDHCGDDGRCTPVIVLDPVTARDTIARAALDWTLERTLTDEEWAALGDEDREQVYALAAALLAALASQERGE